MRTKYSILSDVGQKRMNNQDYADTYENQYRVSGFFCLQMVWAAMSNNVASKLTVEDLGKAWAATHFRYHS